MDTEHTLSILDQYHYFIQQTHRKYKRLQHSMSSKVFQRIQQTSHINEEEFDVLANSSSYDDSAVYSS